MAQATKASRTSATKQVIFRMDREDHKNFRSALMEKETTIQQYLTNAIQLFLDFTRDPASISKTQRSLVKSFLSKEKK